MENFDVSEINFYVCFIFSITFSIRNFFSKLEMLDESVYNMSYIEMFKASCMIHFVSNKPHLLKAY